MRAVICAKQCGQQSALHVHQASPGLSRFMPHSLTHTHNMERGLCRKGSRRRDSPDGATGIGINNHDAASPRYQQPSDESLKKDTPCCVCAMYLPTCRSVFSTCLFADGFQPLDERMPRSYLCRAPQNKKRTTLLKLFASVRVKQKLKILGNLRRQRQSRLSTFTSRAQPQRRVEFNGWFVLRLDLSRVMTVRSELS